MSARGMDERGFTLTEVLVGMTIMLVVLTATLTLFETFVKADRRNNAQNDAQDRARAGTDGLARELRNLASPTNEQPEAVDRAGSYDIVFKAADPKLVAGSQNTYNTRRVRYCLNSSDPTNAKLYRQVQTWTTSTVPSVPATTSCPDSAWPTQTLVAEKITNRNNGLNRPLFVYVGNPAVPSTISGVHTELFIDPDVSKRPLETKLSSGVFLRNQNRLPVADFSIAVRPGGVIVVNGSASADPEGDTLKYTWTVNGVACGSGGVVETCTVPGTGTRTAAVVLKVSDPAGLEATAQKSVTVS